MGSLMLGGVGWWVWHVAGYFERIARLLPPVQDDEGAASQNGRFWTSVAL